MTRLPLPDAPNRETARQLVRVAQIVGRAAADLRGYVVITEDQDGGLDLATNASRETLAELLAELAERARAGQFGRAEVSAPERPEAN